MTDNPLMTTSTAELIGIKLPADGSSAIRVRVSLVVMNDPIARSTTTGTRVCELDCQNDDEERVRITAWREHADRLAESVKKGNLVQFTGLFAKKVFNARFAYGALPYSLNFSNGSNFTVVDDNYRPAGMPYTTIEDLEADIDFLRNNVVDPRVRIRRVKARVSTSGLLPFCQGVIGTVLAYDLGDRSKSLSLKVQIEFVPADKRKILVAGTLLDMRGTVALPQLEGDPVEFRVLSLADVDLRDNGLGPWLDSAKRQKSTAYAEIVSNFDKKTTAAAVPPLRGDSSLHATSGSASSSRSAKSSFLMEVTGTDLTLLKGVAMEDFSADSVEGVHVGSVYSKDLRSDVTVSVHQVPKSGASVLKEGRLLEMRGVLYEEGGQNRVNVVWPQIARSGKLPALAKDSRHSLHAVKRAFAADLRSATSGLQLLTGKVLGEGEQRGIHACFDVFVKDASGKCAVTVAVIGDLRDVQTSEIIEKDVDFRGTMKANASGELEFVVAGWADLIPCNLGENISVPESPSIASLNKNFDFMNTASPLAKIAGKATSCDSTAAIVAKDQNEDVTIVDELGSTSSSTFSIKKENVVDIASDPSFAMLQSGGGHLQVKNRRQSVDGFQRPSIPPLRPRSTRKSAPSEIGQTETLSKKPKSSSSSKGTTRRGSSWLEDLKNLPNADASKDGHDNAVDDVSGDDSVSSANTFNDALSNLSSASNVAGNGRVDFSAFIDDEAKGVYSVSYRKFMRILPII